MTVELCLGGVVVNSGSGQFWLKIATLGFHVTHPPTPNVPLKPEGMFGMFGIDACDHYRHPEACDLNWGKARLKIMRLEGYDSSGAGIAKEEKAGLQRRGGA